jgi:hypothetical protein
MLKLLAGFHSFATINREYRMVDTLFHIGATAGPPCMVSVAISKTFMNEISRWNSLVERTVSFFGLMRERKIRSAAALVNERGVLDRLRCCPSSLLPPATKHAESCPELSLRS